MPPAGVMEVLVELGLLAAAVVFLIVLVIIGTLMLVAEVVLQGKKLHIYFILKQESDDSNEQVLREMQTLQETSAQRTEVPAF